MILLLKSLGVKDVMRFDLLDPPPRHHFLHALHHLFLLGALDAEVLQKFLIDPHYSATLILYDTD